MGAVAEIRLVQYAIGFAGKKIQRLRPHETRQHAKPGGCELLATRLGNRHAFGRGEVGDGIPIGIDYFVGADRFLAHDI